MLFLVVNEAQPISPKFLTTVLQTILSVNDCELLDDRQSAVTEELRMLGTYEMHVKFKGPFDKIL